MCFFNSVDGWKSLQKFWRIVPIMSLEFWTCLIDQFALVLFHWVLGRSYVKLNQPRRASTRNSEQIHAKKGNTVTKRSEADDKGKGKGSVKGKGKSKDSREEPEPAKAQAVISWLQELTITKCSVCELQNLESHFCRQSATSDVIECWLSSSTIWRNPFP